MKNRRLSLVIDNDLGFGRVAGLLISHQYHFDNLRITRSRDPSCLHMTIEVVLAEDQFHHLINQLNKIISVLNVDV